MLCYTFLKHKPFKKRSLLKKQRSFFATFVPCLNNKVCLNYNCILLGYSTQLGTHGKYTESIRIFKVKKHENEETTENFN